jgi:hypothetical protein
VIALITASDREATAQVRGRLALRERHGRFLTAAGILDVAQDAGKDRVDSLHGGPLAVVMPDDTTPDPAGSTNPGGNSRRRNA